MSTQNTINVDARHGNDDGDNNGPNRIDVWLTLAKYAAALIAFGMVLKFLQNALVV